MSARPYILAETNWAAVRSTAYEIAILPWGATEAHNYHLPYATDVMQADYVAAESAKRAWEAGAKVIVLPTVPFGTNTGQSDIKFDINMNPSTQLAVLRDVVDHLCRHKIPKLVVMNGHGGNDFRQMIRELIVPYPNIFLCTLSWYEILDAKKYFAEPGNHADEMETSAMLHIAPQLVRPLSEAGDGASLTFKPKGLRDGWVWAQRHWSKITKDTGVGNPAQATAEKGARYLGAVAQEISEFLVELARCDNQNLYG